MSVTEKSALGGGLRVLVVDDEKNIRTTLAVYLEGMGAEPLAVGTGEAALGALGRQPYDLAFVDLALADESGLDLLPKLLAQESSLAIVLITAYGTIETAVGAIRRGAWDYLAKPFTPAQIRLLVDKLRTERGLTRRVAELEQRLAEVQRRPAVGGDFTVDEIEREHILSVLDRIPKMEDAATLLGIDASTLWRKRKKYEGT